MNDLARNFARRAEEQAAASASLFEADDFTVNQKKQALFIVGKMTANLLHVLSELTAYLRATDQLDEMAIRRKEIMEKSNDIRIAAARAASTGNWDEFDRLTGLAESGSPAGDDA